MCDLANLENLDGAELVRVFTSKEGDERVYAWFGGVMVTILDGELNELDVFNFDCSKTPTLKIVNQQIEIHEDERFADEDHTDDMFYSHEWDTGEDLETQP
jgi:hypothetical protein